MVNKVTLKDIAKASGLSVSTIAHSLQGRSDISENTRQYVVELANRMGYIRNAQASALRTGQTKTIGVITANVANPFFSILMQEIDECASRHDYNVLIFNSYGKVDTELLKIQQALSKNVDGLIISPAEFSGKSIDYLHTLKIPYVVIGRSAMDEQVNYVTVDDEKGSYLATQHLIAHGRRRILYLSGDISMPSAPYRLTGYRRALADAGIPADASLIRCLDLSPSCCERELKALIDGKTPFDGILTFNDMVACEAFYTLYGMGIRVPEDVGLIGFDDIQRAIRVSIPLDSIGTSEKSVGESCVEVLIRHITNHDTPVDHVMLDVQLVDRHSA